MTTRCMTMVCIVILFCAVTACDRERNCTLTETEVTIGDATLDSRMFSLNGVIYTLPLHLSELEANGWRPYDPDNHFSTSTLEPGDYASWDLIDSEQNVGVKFTNLFNEVLLVSESYIIAIMVLHELHTAQVVLPGNIMIGSTVEEVFSTYGDPSSEFTWEDAALFLYSTDYYFVQLLIDTETNLVTTASMHYRDS